MSWVLSNVVLLLLLLVPLVLAGVSARRSIPKAIRAIRGEDVQASLADVFVVLGLIATLIGAQLILVRQKLEDGLQQVATELAQVAPKETVLLSMKPHVAQIMTRISDDIENTSPFGDAATSQTIVRSLFAPGSLPGPGRDQDQVIASAYAGRAYRVTYILGYPSSEIAEARSENVACRAQMLRFAFDLLTDKHWKDVEWGRSKASIYYVPGCRSYDTWTVDGSKGRAAGIVSYVGEWNGLHTRPTSSALMTSTQSAFFEMIKAEEDLLQNRAVEFLKAEQLKDPYHRDPITVFCDRTMQLSLEPRTVEEITRIAQELAAQWDVDTDSRRPKPTPLQELESLVIYLNQRDQAQ